MVKWKCVPCGHVQSRGKKPKACLVCGIDDVAFVKVEKRKRTVMKKASERDVKKLKKRFRG